MTKLKKSECSISHNRTMTKHNEEMQSGKPLTPLAASILEANDRVESYWTEHNNYRTIHIRLADGYNYEGRRYIVSPEWAEVKINLEYIEEGEPEEEC